MKFTVLVVIICCILGAAGCMNINHSDVMRGQFKKLRGFGRNPPPAIVIDRAASELDVNYNTWEALYLNRGEILSALEQTWNQQVPRSQNPLPARISITGEVRDNTGWIIGVIIGGMFYGAWPVLGLPSLSSNARVEITMQIQGHEKIHGGGAGSCYAGMYYPGAPGPCAFSKALASAVRNAVTQAESDR